MRLTYSIIALVLLSGLACGEESSDSVHGLWGPWLPWDPCSRSCGRGIQHRVRHCSRERCVGHQREIRICQECIDYGGWSPWGRCSSTCGFGLETRYRNCSGECSGRKPALRLCNIKKCPVTGWSDWSAWTTICSSTCGNGVVLRSRVCLGRLCVGEKTVNKVCNQGPCPGAWLEWGQCTVTCGGGIHTRTRSCTSPECTTSSQSNQTTACNRIPCPTTATQPPTLASTPASTPPHTQPPTQAPTPASTPPHTQPPATTHITTKPPTVKPTSVTWSTWTLWSSCHPTCGVGTKSRNRNCTEAACTSRLQMQSIRCDNEITCEGLEVHAECGLSNTPFSIIGGSGTNEGQWPWQANIVVNNGTQRCGGAIISNRNILTAAHCFKYGQQKVGESDVNVLLGSLELDGGTVYGVMEINVHPSFNSNLGMQNDLAVLRVSKDIDFSSTIRPVCLPENAPRNGSVCTVTGWGRTSPTSGLSTELKMTSQMILSDEYCQAAWNASGQGFFYHADTMFCGGPNARNNVPYRGDSGGPMSCPGDNFVVQGIVSAGNPNRRQPTVYTDVYVFREWIKEAMIYPKNI